MRQARSLHRGLPLDKPIYWSPEKRSVPQDASSGPLQHKLEVQITGANAHWLRFLARVLRCLSSAKRQFGGWRPYSSVGHGPSCTDGGT